MSPKIASPPKAAVTQEPGCPPDAINYVEGLGDLKTAFWPFSKEVRITVPSMFHSLIDGADGSFLGCMRFA